MSDGPHRSLPMRRGWKRVAECGDNHAFAPEEVSEAIIPALEQDCRVELPEQFLDAAWRIFHDPEPALFKVEIGPQLEALRHMAGPGIGRTVLDHAILAAESGRTGMEGLVDALTNALYDRGARGARQVEEHYCRKTTAPRGQRVRARIEEGIGVTGMDGLARRILKIDQGSPAKVTLHQGLDDGVRL